MASASRTYLREFPLETFGTEDPRIFARELDHRTDELLAALPSEGRHWGVARKVINIFLRDALYCATLREHYGLDLAEAHFELPLDRETATRLITVAPMHDVEWCGVRYVKKTYNQKCQTAASQYAASLGTFRVHLDAHWWSVSRDEPVA